VPGEQLGDGPPVGAERPLGHGVPLQLDQADPVLGQRPGAAAQDLELETLDVDLHARHPAAADQRVDRDHPGLDRGFGVQAVAGVPAGGEPADRARSADSGLSTRSRASAGTKAGQRAARTLSELSKFTQPGVGDDPHPTLTLMFACCAAMVAGKRFAAAAP
jgi:hypothetical protein